MLIVNFVFADMSWLSKEIPGRKTGCMNNAHNHDSFRPGRLVVAHAAGFWEVLATIYQTVLSAAIVGCSTRYCVVAEGLQGADVECGHVWSGWGPGVRRTSSIWMGFVMCRIDGECLEVKIMGK